MADEEGLSLKRMKPAGKRKMDFVADQLQDGSRFRSLTIVDVFTRKVLAIEVGQSLKEDDLVRTLNRLNNAFVESSNGTFRAECLNAHWFLDLREARQLIESWRREYKESRPHASLDDRTPSEFARERAGSEERNFHFY